MPNTHHHASITTHIFLTGGTGYIGGSVLSRLLSHPLSDTFRIATLVRDPAKASQFRSMGIHAVVGSNSDLDILRREAADADLVVACASPLPSQKSADSDDLGAAKAILEGLKQRHQATGRVSSLVHTSGTGVLIDDARGMFATNTIYSDLNIPQLESLPESQPHREVDLALVEADGEGYVKTYIVLPSTIYGLASGPLVDAGLQNSHSQQIPTLVRVSLDRGQAGMVGAGKNIWPNVHIDEVADLFSLLISLIVGPRSGSKPRQSSAHFEHGAAGFYFAENGEHTLHAVGLAIGRSMVALGLSADAAPTSFTKEEEGRYFPNGTSLGTNSRCRAERARAIGWEPVMTTEDMLESIRDEFVGNEEGMDDE